MAGSQKLGARARRAIESSRNDCYLSVATVWEMAIKVSLGKLRLGLPLAELVQEGTRDAAIHLLEVRAEDAVMVAGLPWHHSDPFDRLLVAQALNERLAVASVDAVFESYGVRRIW